MKKGGIVMGVTPRTPDTPEDRTYFDEGWGGAGSTRRGL
jgi:hypothetical protein